MAARMFILFPITVEETSPSLADEALTLATAAFIDKYKLNWSHMVSSQASLQVYVFDNFCYYTHSIMLRLDVDKETGTLILADLEAQRDARLAARKRRDEEQQREYTAMFAAPAASAHERRYDPDQEGMADEDESEARLEHLHGMGEAERDRFYAREGLGQ